MQAIKNFCNNCVGDIRSDITNCSAKQCSLYIYRPYQKDEAWNSTNYPVILTSVLKVTY
jgi:hypothetical protein